MSYSLPTDKDCTDSLGLISVVVDIVWVEVLADSWLGHPSLSKLIVSDSLENFPGVLENIMMSFGQLARRQ